MNPALLLLLLPFLTSTGRTVKDGTKTVYNDTKSGVWNQPIFLIAIIALVIWASSKWSQSKKESYLNNAGNDKDVQQANRLYSALFSNGFFNPLSNKWIGTTDEDALYAVAREVKDYNSVSDAYNVIYSRNLSTDINDNLDPTEAAKFWQNIRLGAASSGTTPTTTPTTTTGTTTTKPATTTAKLVYAKEAVNGRDFTKPGTILKLFKKDEYIGTYIGETYLNDVPNKGQRSLFVHARSTILYIWDYDYYVLKNSVKLV